MKSFLRTSCKSKGGTTTSVRGYLHHWYGIDDVTERLGEAIAMIPRGLRIPVRASLEHHGSAHPGPGLG
jgi:hypothetical protein